MSIACPKTKCAGESRAAGPFSGAAELAISSAAAAAPILSGDPVADFNLTLEAAVAFEKCLEHKNRDVVPQK